MSLYHKHFNIYFQESITTVQFSKKEININARLYCDFTNICINVLWAKENPKLCDITLGSFNLEEFMIFFCILWHWQFWRIEDSYFLQYPSIWVCLVLSREYALLIEIPQNWYWSLSVLYLEQCVILGAVSLSHYWQCWFDHWLKVVSVKLLLVKLLFYILWLLSILWGGMPRHCK